MRHGDDVTTMTTIAIVNRIAMMSNVVNQTKSGLTAISGNRPRASKETQMRRRRSCNHDTNKLTDTQAPRRSSGQRSLYSGIVIVIVIVILIVIVIVIVDSGPPTVSFYKISCLFLRPGLWQFEI